MVPYNLTPYSFKVKSVIKIYIPTLAHMIKKNPLILDQKVLEVGEHETWLTGWWGFLSNTSNHEIFFFNFITVTLSLTFANKHGIVNTLITPPPSTKKRKYFVNVFSGYIDSMKQTITILYFQNTSSSTNYLLSWMNNNSWTKRVTYHT